MESLEARYGIEVNKEELDMPSQVDGIGNHVFKASFFSRRFENNFTFQIDVEVAPPLEAEVI